MSDAVTVTSEKPLWRRIVDFPLVTMLVALAIVIICFTIGQLIGQFLLPNIPGFSKEMKFDLASIPLVLIAYELIIRRLGEHPRDDYRDPHALRNLAIGLGAGFLVFSLAVAVAAILGVYRITGEGDASGLLPALIGPAIFAAVSEELIFRGILFHKMPQQFAFQIVRHHLGQVNEKSFISLRCGLDLSCSPFFIGTTCVSSRPLAKLVFIQCQ